MPDHPKKKKPNHALQILKMQQRYPQFRWSGRNGNYEFIGVLRPRRAHSEYLVKILYRQWRDPRVFVLKPEIEANAPHWYPDTKALCLYDPKQFDWDESLFIADYIVLGPVHGSTFMISGKKLVCG